MAARRELRPYIYLGLDQLAVIIYVVVIVKVVPTWMTSAKIHLWSIPIALQIMTLGMASVFVPRYRKRGRWVAIAGGSLILLSTFLIIVRLLASAAFLAGVYGAFGQAAASGALVAVALVIEVVALLPIVQVKWLMSRAGRRVYT
ncbi:MAG: hypothetical protein ABI467_21275 [Kofleriaceae bacterium]